MVRKIMLVLGRHEFRAELNDSETSSKIWKALPFEAAASTWGNEIYFGIPVHAALEPDASSEREIGDICYWVEGSSMCIFFGRTPASTSDRPKAAAPVNYLGRLVDIDIKALKAIKDGDLIKISRHGGAE